MNARRQIRGVAIIAAALAAAGIFATLAARARAGNPPSAQKWVELITVDGSINPAVASFIDDSIDSASRGGAGALVIELDTPGGLLTSAEQIVKSLLAAPVPVIVYVAPSGAAAASAGTFITEAANIAAMAPGTTIGAAHPVEETGSDIKGVMGKKIENFTATFARNIAQDRGRNEDWIEQAVRHSVAIGEREALQQKVIDIVAPDLRSLLVQASGRKVQVAGKDVTLDLADAVVRRGAMTAGQRVLNTLADPNIVYLLMMAGMLGLYFEFAHPGVFLPGVAGAICLLFAFRVVRGAADQSDRAAADIAGRGAADRRGVRHQLRHSRNRRSDRVRDRIAVSDRQLENQSRGEPRHDLRRGGRDDRDNPGTRLCRRARAPARRHDRAAKGWSAKSARCARRSRRTRRERVFVHGEHLARDAAREALARSARGRASPRVNGLGGRGAGARRSVSAAREAQVRTVMASRSYGGNCIIIAAVHF